MIDSLIHIDKQLFIAIHEGFANPFFDWLLPILRDANTWIPLYAVFVFLTVRKYKLQGLFIILTTLAVVVLCDRFSAGFAKPFFERLRPCHEPTLSAHMRNLIDCGGQYGFISSHATNHFGLAVIFTWFFKKISSLTCVNWLFYAWATLISFAQIYVGKHYFGDVLVGALVGILIGKVILTIFTRLVLTKSLSTD
ncbi:MAG: phosphatase PAP2 family protein [Bacteroidia bacterium]|jgi:undecaprenyl-diphosphatase|nr:phosphatase PAP2 family protein [Bacteroidia bacterium]